MMERLFPVTVDVANAMDATGVVGVLWWRVGGSGEWDVVVLVFGY